MERSAFILHIGRHKTGTSSLQHYLLAEREALARAGLRYAGTGLRRVAHHELAESLRAVRRSEAPESFMTGLETWAAAVRVESEQAGTPLLFSSEAFQNARPADVGRVFPPGRTQVIVYLREQLEYAASAYQQAVHARDHHAPLSAWTGGAEVDYAAFIGKWVATFGAEQVKVRIYDRAQLLQGDVIDDFLGHLGLPRNPDTALADANPSIGRALLEIKRMVNAYLAPEDQRKGVYRIFSEVARQQARFRGRPAYPAALQRRLREANEVGNRALSERHFGGRPVFSGGQPGAGPAAETLMPLSLAELHAAFAALDRLRPAMVARLLEAVCDGRAMPPVAARALRRALRESLAGEAPAAQWPEFLALLREPAGLAPWTWNFPLAWSGSPSTTSA